MPNGKHIFRLGSTKRFYYRYADGRRVAKRPTLEFIDNIKVPPAWVAVEISPSPYRKIWATGLDDAGRKQYIYNPNWRRQRDSQKFDRLVAFGQKLTPLRQATSNHLRLQGLTREKVLACVVRLIDQAYFRVGNETYAEENESYGITTMRTKHLTIRGDTLHFEYTGKSGQEHEQKVVDERVAKVLRELDDLPGYEIFKYETDDDELVKVSSEDVNTYIRGIMGDDFSAKDFRTWAGTLVAAVELAETQLNNVKKAVVAAVKKVAETLGNTPAVARSSYIDPRVISHYHNGVTIKEYLSRPNGSSKAARYARLSKEEIALIKLLQRKA